MTPKTPSQIIEAVLKDFNVHHGVEAAARLVSLDSKKFVLELVGSYCETCGHHDYFDDLIFAFEDAGLAVNKEFIEEKEGKSLVTFGLV